MCRLSQLYSFGGGVMVFDKSLSNDIVCRVWQPAGTINIHISKNPLCSNTKFWSLYSR